MKTGNGTNWKSRTKRGPMQLDFTRRCLQQHDHKLKCNEGVARDQPTPHSKHPIRWHWAIGTDPEPPTLLEYRYMLWKLQYLWHRWVCHGMGNTGIETAWPCHGLLGAKIRKFENLKIPKIRKFGNLKIWKFGKKKKNEIRNYEITKLPGTPGTDINWDGILFHSQSIPVLQFLLSAAFVPMQELSRKYWHVNNMAILQ